MDGDELVHVSRYVASQSPGLPKASSSALGIVEISSEGVTVRFKSKAKRTTLAMSRDVE